MAKKSAGRPAMPEGEKRIARFVVKLNDAEFHAIKAASGPKLTTWAREVLLRAAKRR
jgi:hypothetical protein